MINGILLTLGIFILILSRGCYAEYGYDNDSKILVCALLCDVAGTAMIVLPILFEYGIIK